MAEELAIMDGVNRGQPPPAVRVLENQNDGHENDDGVNNDNDNNINNNDQATGDQDPAQLGPLDSRRMILTDDEVEWALSIKDAVSRLPELDQMTDYMCAHLAIVDQDDLEGAVTKALALQAYREEYKFIDSYEEGRRCLRQLITWNPRQFLSFSYSELEGRYVLVHDANECDITQRAAYRNDRDRIRTFLTGSYFLHHAMTMDFDSIRKGPIVLVECEGYEWKMKQDWKTLQRLFDELLFFYPIRPQVRHFHNGIIFNVLASILKRLLPEAMKDNFHVGCQFDGRLDEVFLVPSVEAANERIMERLGEALERRYKHEQSFRLPPAL